MRILLTGSSGLVGSALAPRLRAIGHDVTGLDPAPSAETRLVGSIADRDLVMRTVRENQIDAIIHSGALHKPNIESRANSDFVATNVQGTLNLLDAAVAAGEQRSDRRCSVGRSAQFPGFSGPLRAKGLDDIFLDRPGLRRRAGRPSRCRQRPAPLRPSDRHSRWRGAHRPDRAFSQPFRLPC
ncbi:NAD(P)-dependent oxidoreductase [Mesorhizobium sp. M1050]|uniref:NAD-dependent epimerase/dehydratase family protein n=1 Tax=Mesorhizobium sp. M1050 TaxID=2957051 RepID=UPI003338987E